MTTITNDEEIIKEKILNELSRIGNGSRRLWITLFICMIPAILNGLHLYSYLILAQIPKNITCVIPELVKANFNDMEIRNISMRNANDICQIRDLDYNLIVTLNNTDMINSYVDSVLNETIACESKNQNYFQFDHPDRSIVSEWNLICDREILRSTVQVALSVGKLFGAITFGIIADKYGRKTSVIIGSFMHMIAGPASAFITNYWIFLVARFFTGVATSAVFHSTNIIITELADQNYRSITCIIFSMSYPIGMILFGFIAYLFESWRNLQLIISVPAFFLIYHYFYLNESPRWLMTKGKLNDAHEIVFGQPIDENIYSKYKKVETEISQDGEKIDEANGGVNVDSSKQSIIRNVLKELVDLYGSSGLRKRALTCHFAWFIVILVYHAIALNGDNFSVDPYLYIVILGLIEIPSFIVPTIMLRFYGRRISSVILYLIGGVSLLIILVIAKDNITSIMIVAMLGRVCLSCVITILFLYINELFPTNVRNTAVGTNSAMSHIGSISAPYIVDILGKIVWYIPTTICGVGSILAGLMMLTLPETRNSELEDTVDETKIKTGK